jgi:hypothetical protein
MNRHCISRIIVALAALLLVKQTLASTNAPVRMYPCGMESAVKVANDLYTTLEPEFQRTINPDPVTMEASATPAIKPIQGNRQGSQICITTGWIDLVNYIAHAKAIDRIQPGYFWQYVFVLANQDPNAKPAPPPNFDSPRYWTDSVMKDQVSYFNEIVSMTMAMNLTHHYLGHCEKYAGQMGTGKTAPLNNLIAPDEWEASVKYAAYNSLNCAISTEGAKCLFEFIGQMQKRPAWTAYFMPPNADVKRLSGELSHYESDYFHGRLVVDKMPVALSVASVPSSTGRRVGN